MASRKVNVLSDMEIDEISLVDRPANQHARIAIAKSAPKEDAVPYFNDQGQVVDPDALELGAVVFDGDGNGFVVTDENDDNDYEFVAESEQEEPELVGKSLAEQVREDLSKAFTDIERDDVISKAMGQIAKAEQRASEAEKIAKSERDLRLTREYISKAADYGIGGVTPDQLGPVLMRAAENLPFEDCTVLHKALTSAGEAFKELGTSGGAENAMDPFGVIDAVLEGQVSKGAEGVTREQLIVKAFTDNSASYDEYRNNMSRRA